MPSVQLLLPFAQVYQAITRLCKSLELQASDAVTLEQEFQWIMAAQSNHPDKHLNPLFYLLYQPCSLGYHFDNHKDYPNGIPTPRTLVFMARQLACQLYSPAVTDPLVLDLILSEMQKRIGAVRLVEIQAGTGYWSQQLAHRGCQVTALEMQPRPIQYMPTSPQDPVKFILEHNSLADTALLLVWPVEENTMHQCLRVYRGPLVFLIGEGCTGNLTRELLCSGFADITPSPDLLPTWYGMADRLTILARDQNRDKDEKLENK